MKYKEKLETVAVLFICAVMAFVSKSVTENIPSLLFMQSAVILVYFFGIPSAVRMILAEKKYRAPSALVLLGYTLYNFTIEEPTLPLFGLSLALGNVLAIYSTARASEMVILIFVSFMIAYFSCILAIIGGMLLDKIKLR